MSVSGAVSSQTPVVSVRRKKDNNMKIFPRDCKRHTVCIVASPGGTPSLSRGWGRVLYPDRTRERTSDRTGEFSDKYSVAHLHVLSSFALLDFIFVLNIC